ncbi:hypothetical protein RRG08_020709 [Elysia crispata]|uniref:Uncharacterized protein n=1 Tax=Elysia crispata TaxID=231223 RepID=A0AAE1B061_9GAST|nr:hypothetical protein RRG08_020709 [Elysia crispata]
MFINLSPLNRAWKISKSNNAAGAELYSRSELMGTKLTAGRRVGRHRALMREKRPRSLHNSGQVLLTWALNGVTPGAAVIHTVTKNFGN